MGIRIVLDTPSADSLQYLLEEMVDDPYVGMYGTETREKWLTRIKKMIETRKELDIQSTVAYDGSGIVGIAFSRQLADQSYCSNMKPENDFWKMGNFYVLKAYRGQGIGKQALNFFLAAKEHKVFYFADRENKASNAVAVACGMHWLHDFFTPRWTENYELCTKDTVVRCPATYFRVYCGIVPSKELLLEPDLVDTSYEEN